MAGRSRAGESPARALANRKATASRLNRPPTVLPSTTSLKRRAFRSAVLSTRSAFFSRNFFLSAVVCSYMARSGFKASQSVQRKPVDGVGRPGHSTCRVANRLHCR